MKSSTIESGDIASSMAFALNNLNTHHLEANQSQELGEQSKEPIENALNWHEKKPENDAEHVFDQSKELYCDGENNSASKSMRQRTMRKALTETNLSAKFTEHDLYSETASDVETIEEAA